MRPIIVALGVLGFVFVLVVLWFGFGRRLAVAVDFVSESPLGEVLMGERRKEQTDPAQKGASTGGNLVRPEVAPAESRLSVVSGAIIGLERIDSDAGIVGNSVTFEAIREALYNNRAIVGDPSRRGDDDFGSAIELIHAVVAYFTCGTYALDGSYDLSDRKELGKMERIMLVYHPEWEDLNLDYDRIISTPDAAIIQESMIAAVDSYLAEEPNTCSLRPADMRVANCRWRDLAERPGSGDVDVRHRLIEKLHDQYAQIFQRIMTCDIDKVCATDVGRLIDLGMALVVQIDRLVMDWTARIEERGHALADLQESRGGSVVDPLHKSRLADLVDGLGRNIDTYGHQKERTSERGREVRRQMHTLRLYQKDLETYGSSACGEDAERD